jgi:hypothetical protein
MTLIIQKDGSDQSTNTLVVGTGLQLGQTADGLPEVSLGGGTGEVVVHPSGADDTAAIQDAMWGNGIVRLAPGTFNVSAIIDIPAGVLVTGTGMDKTTISASHGGAVFRLGDSTEYAGVENLRILGPGQSILGSEGIVAARSTSGLRIARRLRFRNLHLEGFEKSGLFLQDVVQAEVSNVTVASVGKYGLFAKGTQSDAGQLICRGVTVENAGEFGFILQGMYGTESVGLTITGAGIHGVLIESGAGHLLQAVRVANASGRGIVIRTTSGVVMEGVEVQSSPGALSLDRSHDVVLNGCRSQNSSSTPLRVQGGANHLISACLSDQSGASVDVPHLNVGADSAGNGATGVMISAFRRINPSVALTYEADVSGAGGRVLFAQHDFDTTRINGAHYAQI